MASSIQSEQLAGRCSVRSPYVRIMIIMIIVLIAGSGSRLVGLMFSLLPRSPTQSVSQSVIHT